MAILFGIGIILIPIVVFLIYSNSRDMLVKRNIGNAKLIPIGSVEEGAYAKIVGRVEADGELLVSPLSGKPCVAYHIVVEVLVRNGNVNYWSSSHEEEKTSSFFLLDTTGLAYVNVKTSRSHLEKDTIEWSPELGEESDRTRAFLAERNISTTDMLGWNKDIRFKEGLMEVGEVVFTLGYGSWIQSELPSHIDRSEKVLHIQEGKEPVYITDAR